MRNGILKHLIRSIAGLFLLILFTQTQASVWEDKNKWDDTWEQRFQDWVKKDWHMYMFTDPSHPIYYNISTDCADASYDMRLIFAYEHKLPFIIIEPGNPKGRISNKMKKWDKLPEEKRVRKFIDYINNITDTRTLQHDTYPVLLTSLSAGDIYVSPGTHSYQIIDISETGVPITLSSSTPKKTRTLYLEKNFPFFVPKDHKKHSDGYRRFRMPDQIGKPLKELPNASPGQYNLAKDLNHDYFKFTDKVMHMVGKRPESLPETARRLAENLCSYTRERVDYVQDALKYKPKMGGRRCMNAQEYDNYSTPSRDERLDQYFNMLQDFTKTEKWKSTEFSGKDYMESIFFTKPSMTDEQMMDYCQIYYDPEDRSKALNLRNIWRSMKDKRFISDPHANLEQRWGVGDKKFTPKCKTY